ncbi:MFS transporter [Halobacillus salinarum]|uniref:MFS transporter n=1 Tax=Halobacillus salinarum TaxID=2932257 RepID=A0ABY4EK51_9BACI|nr:MFS transporter [Halobacillus salinarum]UOQ44458.1 MFS transporter [Halobacillus salinarum]
MNKFNTYKLLTAYFLYECGRAMYFVLVTWFLYQSTEDALYTGFFVSFGFLPGLVSNLVFGVLVDRYNRKKLALISESVSFSVLVLLFFTAATHLLLPSLMIGVHMVMQTTGSLFRPSLQALVAEVFDKETLPKMFSFSNSATISGSLSGAAIGGFLSGWLPLSNSLLIVTSLYGCSWLAVTLLDYERKFFPSSNTKFRIVSELRDGANYLKKNPMLYGLFTMMMLGQLTFHTTIGFLSVYTSGYLHSNAVTYGFLDASFSIGGIAAGFLGTWWWVKWKNFIAVWSLVTVAVGLFLLGTAPYPAVAFIGVLCTGLGTTWVRALLQSVQQIATDKRYHGRMASFRMLGNQASVVLTGSIFGAVAASQGANMVFLCLLIPILLGVLWAVFQSRHPSFKAITDQKSA